MKNGVIIDYNGSNGIIVDSNSEEYILLAQNIMYDNPKNGDQVSFAVEVFKTIEIEEKIATFVRKIESE